MVYRTLVYSMLSGGLVLAAYALGGLWSSGAAVALALACATTITAFAVIYAKSLLAGLQLESLAAAQLSHLRLNTAIPWSDFAITPRVLSRVLHEIQARGATRIVECGSGVSTLLIGAVLKSLGSGRLISLEHDADWAAYVQRLVDANGLSDYVSLVQAKLSPAEHFGVETRWYDVTSIRDALGALTGIDVLIVDGPPQRSGNLARLSALPFFAEALADGALVVVDDLHRRDEQNVVKTWKKHFALTQLVANRQEGYGLFEFKGPGRA